MSFPGGPSERAIEAASAELERHDLVGLTAGRAAVEAAFPIIIADVAEWLKARNPYSPTLDYAARVIERELGGMPLG